MEPLDRDVVLKLVSDIRIAVQQARALVEKPYDELDLYKRLALRYLVVELVEAASTLCLHLIRDVDIQGYPHCFLILAELGLVDRGLGERLASAARLRNLLVHRYWIIDDRLLYSKVKEGLSDFLALADIAERLLEGGG